MIKSNNTSLTFSSSQSPEDQQEVGLFIEPETESWSTCESNFDNILEGAVSTSEYLATLKEIIKQEPAFLDAYAHLGSAFYHNNLLGDAEKWYSRGLKLAMSLIPEKFVGTIPWHTLSNRPFLRLHHGFTLCQLSRKRYKKAVKLMEAHLAWNSNDNIGVRFLIGDACLICDMTMKARQFLTDAADEYPPAAYSMALLEFKNANFVEAATRLRQGIASNIYIAEALTGRTALGKHFFWHSSNRCSPDTAEDYLKHFGYEMWQATNGAIDFCDWLLNCSDVLRERAEFAEATEGLTYERGFNERGVFVDKLSSLRASIDASLSRQIVKRYTNRDGNQVWPWERDRLSYLSQKIVS